MIEITLADGQTLEFADDASADEIWARCGRVRLAEPLPQLPDMPPRPPGYRPPLVSQVEPFIDDSDPETAAIMARLPATVRELLRRSRLPASQAAQPAEDIFRDNFRIWGPWQGA